MHTHPKGFSLVELSIVLVILGLLVGGILAGQSLIRASELRAVGAESSRYLSATAAFRDKYFALPGDMRNATAFWSASTTNGNADGFMDQASTYGVTGEIFQFWTQLALAGLVEGTYSGLAGSAAGNAGQDTVLGVNAPYSKAGRAGWGIRYWSSIGDSNTPLYSYKNTLIFGAQNPGYANYAAALMPTEAWNIDKKLDDGKPASGKIFMRSVTAFGTATACSAATSMTDYSADYNLAVTTLTCALYFPNAF